ncbi:MAG: redoxin domain-containing protein [Bryobacteraceae bacterium]|nr:redoxin domain-containing protein [Bryobacteraceae bacterium]
MNRRSFVCASLTAPGVLAAQSQPTPPPKTHLKVGDAAPDFRLPATTGNPISLSDFRGKKTVVVGFFPAAFTGGCTKEVKAYEEGIAKFQEMGAEVLLISTDNLPTLSHWAGEMGVSYPMLSDFMRKASKSYGVLIEERGVANRATFVVDAAGKIQHIEEGSSAIDPTSAANACSRIKQG